MDQSPLSSVTRALRIVKYFRAIDADMPSQFIDVFLEIATNPGVTTRKLMDSTGISQSAMSRATRALAIQQMNGEAGHQLIVGTPDPADSRVIQWSLTARGTALKDAIDQVVQGNFGPDPSIFRRGTPSKAGPKGKVNPAAA